MEFHAINGIKFLLILILLQNTHNLKLLIHVIMHWQTETVFGSAVVDQISNSRIIAADGAFGIPGDLDLSKGLLQCIVYQ